MQAPETVNTHVQGIRHRLTLGQFPTVLTLAARLCLLVTRLLSLGLLTGAQVEAIESGVSAFSSKATDA